MKFAAIIFSIFVFLLSANSFSASTVTVKLPKAKKAAYGNPVTVKLPPARVAKMCSSIARNVLPTKQALNLGCIAERAKYKCTVLGKPIQAIGTFYGHGDKNTDKTLCEKPFRPDRDKLLALQDDLIPREMYTSNFCGRKAIVLAFEPDTGRCRSTVVEVSDTGNLTARDHDNNKKTRDRLHMDTARVGDRDIRAPKAFDLSYAAARALGYNDDGKAFMEVSICQEMIGKTLEQQRAVNKWVEKNAAFKKSFEPARKPASAKKSPPAKKKK